MDLNKFCKELENQIIAIYDTGITMEDAEKLAAKFLHGQIVVSEELKKLDLAARMRKSGLKAVRAAVYTEARSKAEGKTTEAQIAAVVDTHELTLTEQNGLDEAEVERDALERYYDIFRDGHIYTRGIAKGNFGG